MKARIYDALKRSRDRYKAMRATNKGLVTELAEAQRPKEPDNALQAQEVPDTAPNPLQEPYNALNKQHETLKQEKETIALKLENLEKNMPYSKIWMRIWLIICKRLPN
ncbi:hypothetical protein [Helicobacter ailurogastricus]|uniref:hypothetical protein n=1 Tax=Helicobacter ailurogastricus TaxID=1578720 RepID=UPI0025570C8D|nr:hypothetical protein [Helicobacter ailurogastricus]